MVNSELSKGIRMIRILLCASVFLSLCQSSLGLGFATPSTDLPPLSVAEAESYQHNHSGIFIPPHIVHVTTGVYSAVGYALGNMILVEANNAVIIIDTTETAEDGWIAYQALRNASQNYHPLVAIIITHFHTDHYGGTFRLLEDAEERGWSVNLYTHSTTVAEQKRLDQVAVLGVARAARQFGQVLLPEIERINVGIGYSYKQANSILNQTLNPTHVYDDRQFFKEAGLDFELIHIPGETNDQTAIWFPTYGAVCPGDDFYHTFPNIYTIRGAPNRDAKHWFQSLDRILALNASYIVPSHSEPVSGNANVNRILTTYRDAVKFSYDQTVRYTNLDYDIDDVVAKVKLPEPLRMEPHLLEFYGSIDWSIRSIFGGHIGWFDGDAATLNRLSKKQFADKMTTLIPVATLVQKAQENFDLSNTSYAATGIHLKEQLQWALELATMVLRTGYAQNSYLETAKQIKMDTLHALARAQLSSIGRNYYLSVRREMQLGVTTVYPPSAVKQSLQAMIPSYFMAEYPLRFNAEKCIMGDNDMTVLFNFTDDGLYKYTIRNCVVDLMTKIGINDQFDFVANMDSAVWKNIVTGEITLIQAYGQGQIEFGSSSAWWQSYENLNKFLGLMDTSGFLTPASAAARRI